MLEGQRRLFDIPDEVAYFDCATMSPLLQSVHAACGNGLAREFAPWSILPSTYLDAAEPSRAIAASIIGAEANDIAFVPGATYGIAVAAQNIPLSTGKKIIIAAGQHTANAYSWQKAAARIGAIIQIVGASAAEDWTSAVLAAITNDTAVAALPPFHSSDGRPFDLVRIGARLRQVGSALVVDATHSIGARKIDVREIQPDFMVAGAYKWLLGPYATGILYVSPTRQNGSPLEEPGLNRRGAYDFENNTAFHEDYLLGARRFDVSGRGNFGAIAGLEAALRHVADLGIAAIEAHIGSLTRHIAAEVVKIDAPWVTAPSARGHYASIEFAQADAVRLGRALRAAKVFASFRNGWLRITPHIYNTKADVDLLVGEIRKVFR
jgi:selenocysteine lyase/cysteine desulfurase